MQSSFVVFIATAAAAASLGDMHGEMHGDAGIPTAPKLSDPRRATVNSMANASSDGQYSPTPEGKGKTHWVTALCNAISCCVIYCFGLLFYKNPKPSSKITKPEESVPPPEQCSEVAQQESELVDQPQESDTDSSVVEDTLEEVSEEESDGEVAGGRQMEEKLSPQQVALAFLINAAKEAADRQPIEPPQIMVTPPPLRVYSDVTIRSFRPMQIDSAKRQRYFSVIGEMNQVASPNNNNVHKKRGKNGKKNKTASNTNKNATNAPSELLETLRKAAAKADSPAPVTSNLCSPPSSVNVSSDSCGPLAWREAFGSATSTKKVKNSAFSDAMNKKKQVQPKKKQLTTKTRSAEKQK